MRAARIESEFTFPNGNEISGILYLFGRLEITVATAGDTRAVTVIFPEVAGFRVLDESDLAEFWPSCSIGWLFQIMDGGWLAQESRRKGFVRAGAGTISEYLVTGMDDCVSVLAWQRPDILPCRV